MVQAIAINSFKSHRKSLLTLAPLTLLIGTNASGKTNAIEALRFISRLSYGQRIDDILEDVGQNDLAIRGKITDIAYDGGDSHPIAFVIGFGIVLANSSAWNRLYLTIALRTNSVPSQIIRESIEDDERQDEDALYKAFITDVDRYEMQVSYDDFLSTEPRPIIFCSNRQAIFTQLDVPSRFATPEAQEIIPAVVTEFQQALRNIIFLDLNPRAMVDYSFIVDHTQKPDGRNLSSVLYHICETQGRKAEVLAFIGELPEQRISDVGFLVGPRQEVMVTLTETFGHTPVTREAPLLSDGTLRVLAVAAALLSAPKGGLVVIEEIDNGVHPSRAKALLANILAASKANSLRVLLTSHNPALLDTLPKESVPDVVCCYRDPEQGDSRLVRLADLTDYPDLVARGPLGQLMTQGLLDRYLKNQRTPEQKAEQAQEWLRQLQLEDEEDAA